MNKSFFLSFVFLVIIPGYTSENPYPFCGNDGLPLRTIYIPLEKTSFPEALEDICERLNCPLPMLPACINTSLDDCENTYAHYAAISASKYYWEVCKYLGADLRQKNCCGITPLDYLGDKPLETPSNSEYSTTDTETYNDE